MCFIINDTYGTLKLRAVLQICKSGPNVYVYSYTGCLKMKYPNRLYNRPISASSGLILKILEAA